MLRPHFSLIILSFFISLIVFTNFSSSHFLMGWDNLIPELNSLLNIKRSIFSVWQEHQGLGILPGNAHAAELPHQIITLLLSFISPLHLVRWIYTFGMLAIGTFSAFFLIRRLLGGQKANMPALLGGLFYLFNLATIQNFFIPFEPFITFFGFLPLLILTAINFVESPNRKFFFIFLITNLFAIPLAQVPTIFIVYIFTLFCVLTGFYVQNRASLKNIFKIILITLIINSFWLLPFLYFTFTNSGVAFDAKINQMATPVVFQQNKEFGGLTDVMLLKGFWFNNIDLGQVGFGHMFESWRDHLNNPFISLIGYIFFIIILTGAFFTIKSKNRILWGFLFIFTISIILLTVNTPPFSFINSLLREIPLFNQVFRSPFTKFSTVASLMYAIFFAIRIKQISQNFSSKFLGIALLILLLIYALPVFQGEFFYSRVKTTPPKEYFELFRFFQNQDPNTRIANFPQYTFWGWSFYDWGYGGSGFLWYGLPQPVLDRAFDVWGKTNENYYWEISQALYSKNPDVFNKVLNKYQINWLIIDENIVSSDSQKILFNKELKELIQNLSNVKKAQTFGKIDVYRVVLNDKAEKFVFLSSRLPRVNGYGWGSDDIAYQNLGNYISSAKTSSNFEYFYPFRSLFSNKTVSDQEFEVKENENSIDFIADLFPSEKAMKLTLPSFNQIENVIPIELMQTKNEDGGVLISARVKTPEIFMKTGVITKIWEEKRENPLFLIPPESYPFNLNINGTLNLEIDPRDHRKILGSAFLVKGQENIILITNPSSGFQDAVTISAESLDYASSAVEITIPQASSKNQIIVRISKIDDSYLGIIKTPQSLYKEELKNCDMFRDGQYSQELITWEKEKLLKLSSKKATACTSYYSANLIHDQGYLIFVKNANLKGNPLHFWVLNEDEDYAPINTYLSKDKKISDSVIILPPQERFGSSYSFHFENPSVVDESINYLGRVASYPIPYRFLSLINLSRKDFGTQRFKPNNLKVSHPNQSLYTVSDLDIKNNQTLVLSQSYDKGWKAYEMVNSQWSIVNKLQEIFPFIFGKPVGEHVLVNNWANGWTLDSNNGIMKQSNNYIVIVYLPQYLQYIGFILTLGTFATLTFIYIRRKS